LGAAILGTVLILAALTMVCCGGARQAAARHGIKTMRGLVGAAGIVFAVLIVSIGAARWLGQRYGEPPFPADDRGCWDGCVS